MTPPVEMLRYQRRDQRRREDLADNGFEIGQAADDRMDRENVAVPGRSQRHQAEINQHTERLRLAGSEINSLQRSR
jgi:hypothetical protein